MGNNTEVVFEDIEQRILKEIEDARYAIFVSVAWFTNKKLFNALLEKARNNCYVSIIIQLDDINSQCGIDYSEIQIGRSECFIVSKEADLLHDKFCVIDFRKVITGSYNWTYKASHNSENVIISNDPTLASQFITRFEQQKVKFKDSAIYREAPVASATPKVVNTPKVVETPKPAAPTATPVVVQTVPSVKKCPYCDNKVGNNDAYCENCGRLQSGHRKTTIVVTCKKCSRKQEEALIDAESTKFCTFCGSDKLEWTCN
jgi:hypothetical protein